MVNKFFHYFSVKADKKAEVERTIKSEQERIVMIFLLPYSNKGIYEIESSKYSVLKLIILAINFLGS
jgi:hypothetical protein